MKSKIKNFVIKTIVALCFATLLITIEMIESGRYIAFLPFAIAVLTLYLFSKANGYTLD